MKMSLLFNDKTFAPILFATSIAANLSFLLFIRSASSLSSRLPKGPPIGKLVIIPHIICILHNIMSCLAKKLAGKISFGIKEGEYRGDNAMNPPRIRVDHYSWLRDETREDKEVNACYLILVIFNCLSFSFCTGPSAFKC